MKHQSDSFLETLQNNLFSIFGRDPYWQSLQGNRVVCFPPNCGLFKKLLGEKNIICCKGWV